MLTDEWEPDPEVARAIATLQGYGFKPEVIEHEKGEADAMPLIIKDEQKEYPLPPEGLHQAVCVDVIDKGEMETMYGPKHKLDVRWQLDADDPTGRPFQVMKRYTASLHEKSTLCKDLEGWRGKRFTKKEKEGFDVEHMIGANCQVQVVHNLSDDGRKWANVQAVVPLGKGMTPIAARDYTRQQDRPTGNGGGGGGDTGDAGDMPF